jgi:C4-type Zn-finger protein
MMMWIPFTFALAPAKIGDINPWSFWLKMFNHNALFSVTNNYQGDQEIEQSVISEVAGYGSQLSKVEDALSILLKKITEQNANFSKEEKEKINAYQKMVDEIEEKKRDLTLAKFSFGGVGALVDELTALKKNNPTEFKNVSAKLKKALG